MGVKKILLFSWIICRNPIITCTYEHFDKIFDKKMITTSTNSIVWGVYFILFFEVCVYTNKKVL